MCLLHHTQLVRRPQPMHLLNPLQLTMEIQSILLPVARLHLLAADSVGDLGSFAHPLDLHLSHFPRLMAHITDILGI